MPFAKGHPRFAGRKAGAISQGYLLKRTVAETCERMKCDPFEGMAIISSGRVPCVACEAKGKVKREGKLVDCLVCSGIGYQLIPPELRLKAYAELGQYIQPKRKAIELIHTGIDSSERNNSPITILIEKLNVLFDGRAENSGHKVVNGTSSPPDTLELAKLGS